MIQQRLHSLFAALLAFGVLILINTPPADPDTNVSLPHSQDQGDYGLYVLFEWFKQQALPVQSWQKKYTALDQLDGTQHLLITSIPQLYDPTEAEITALRAWLEKGNQILLLSAHHDSPDWLLQIPAWHMQRFLAALDLNMLEIEPSEADQPDQSQQNGSFEKMLSRALEDKSKHQRLAELIPIPDNRHPLTQSKVMDTLQSHYLSPQDIREWQLQSKDQLIGLPLLQDNDNNNTVFWEIPIVSGRIWLSSYASLFSNQQMQMADNARFIYHLAQLTLPADQNEQAQILFDDYHFGIAPPHQADLFLQDSRFHQTLWFLFALWTVYILGYSKRFAPLAKPAAPLLAVDFVQHCGHFFARHLKAAHVANGLISHFHNRMRQRYHQVQNGQPLWDTLDRYASAEQQVELQQLRQFIERYQGKRRINLLKLSQLLARVDNTQH